MNYKIEMNGDHKIYHAAVAYGDIYFIERVFSAYRVQAKGSFSEIGVPRKVHADELVVRKEHVRMWLDLMYISKGKLKYATGSPYLFWLYAHKDISHVDLQSKCDYAYISIAELLKLQPLRVRILYYSRKYIPFTAPMVANAYYSLGKK